MLRAVKEMLDASKTSITVLISSLLGAYKNRLVGVAKSNSYLSGFLIIQANDEERMPTHAELILLPTI